MNLGRYGVWAGRRSLDPAVAAEIESLGYGSVWIGGSPPADLQLVSDLLAATTSLVVATGIVNIWSDPASVTARSYARVADAFPDRFLLGIGAGHREHNVTYEKPYEALVRYLDELDAGGVPVSGRVLAALGPRVLELSAMRCRGAHPYLVPVAHTRYARSVLGPDVLLVPEHKVVLETDPATARAIGRKKVENPYLGLSNYVSNLRRLGYSEQDVAGHGSDRLIDDLVAHGSPDEVARRVTEHLDAGADQVCVQPLPRSSAEGILPTLRELAAALQ